MTNNNSVEEMFEELAHALFEVKDGFWDAIELGKDFISEAYNQGYKDGFGKDCKNGAREYLKQKGKK